MKDENALRGVNPTAIVDKIECFIDTNIFLRTLDGSAGEQYETSVALLRAVKDSKVKAYWSNLVVSEIAWTLRSFYKFPKNDITRITDGIFNLKNLYLNENYDLPRAIEYYSSYNIKFIDAQIAAMDLVQNQGVIIATYDADFMKIPGIKSSDPASILRSIRL